MTASQTPSRDPSGADLQPLSHPIEAAIARLGTSRGTLYKLIAAGEIRTYSVGKRRYVTEAALRDFVARREAASA